MATIKDLQKIQKKLRSSKGTDFCGLVTVPDIRYESTPKNAIPFATTEGDGVHYSALTGKNIPKNQEVIAMTLPMTGTTLVLAETFDEFLGLGYYHGWFPLEQLVYDLDDTIDFYSIPKKFLLSKEDMNFLRIIREEFNMKPVPLTVDRLKELQATYHIDIDEDTKRLSENAIKRLYGRKKLFV